MIAKCLAQWVFTAMGWRFKNDMPADVTQCVMIAAPHTSNWDALYTKLGMVLMGLPVKVTIKDSYMRFPLGYFVRLMGGVGINRTPKQEGVERPSMVEEMAKLFKEHPNFIMLVTPEGTRGRVTKWKTGFYHVAVAAQVPIALGYVDYAHKIAGIGGVLWPSGDMQADMQKIMTFYQGITGKFPELFSVDCDYQAQ